MLQLETGKAYSFCVRTVKADSFIFHKRATSGES